MARRKRNGDEPEPSIGHNSGLSAASKKALHGYISEIELIEEQIAPFKEDLSNIYRDAKEHGFDTRALRAIVKERRMDPTARETLHNAIDSYKHALGMLADTPLGEAALAREQSQQPA